MCAHARLLIILRRDPLTKKFGHRDLLRHMLPVPVVLLGLLVDARDKKDPPLNTPLRSWLPNLLTLHGKSRYPGLFVWLRDGTKMLVKIPDGCLLVQAGMQIERLTGGAVEARNGVRASFLYGQRHDLP